MTRGAGALVVAAALAGLGVFLAIDAWLAGSLFRYVLAGLVVGGALCLPLLTLLLFGARARRVWRRLAFALVPLGVLLALAEVAWRVATGPGATPAVLVPDARLGHVLAPDTGGTDARGFRNRDATGPIDVLLVGDSQTWGFGVEDDETFAAQLAELTGTRTYQMANGSYGPVQYRELVRRGRDLAPRLVVVALYFGNDLVDAVDYAGLDGAEDVRTAGRDYRVRVNEEFFGASAPNRTMAAIDWVLGHSRLLDAAARVVKSRLQGGLLDDQPGAVPFDDPQVGTILLPAYRLGAVDASDPTIADGIAVTGRCLAETARACRELGARVALLAIPTKEYCYAVFREDLTALAPIRAAEAAARAAVFAAAERAGVELVDLAPRCVAALRDGDPPWRAGGDGHLAAGGHRLAAELLAACWRR